MKPKKDEDKSDKLIGVEAALRRAGQRAREIAARTGTPLVIFSEGKIKKLRIRPKPVARST